MAKGKRSKIQRREAYKIARKLDAEINVSGAKHDRAKIYRGDTLIAQYRISRGHRTGHGHVPEQLYINVSKALAIANCSISREEYFDLLDHGAGSLPTPNVK